MRRLAGFALYAALLPMPALAHLVGVELGGLHAGALHVVSAIDYLAVLAGLALLAGAQPGRSAATAVATAATGLLLGAVAGTRSLVSAAEADAGLLAATVVLGAAAMLGLTPRPLPLTALAGTCAFALGLSNGLAAAEGGVDRALFSLGVAGVGALAILLAAALLRAAAAQTPLAPTAMRIAGGWVAAFGIVASTVRYLGLGP